MSDAPITKFTLELEGHPDEVGRVWAAMSNAFQQVEREAYDRDRDMFFALRLGGPQHYRGSSLRGTITVSKADIHAVLGR